MTTPYAAQFPASGPRPARIRVGRLMLTAFVVTLFLACGLVVFSIIGSDTGFTGAAVGVVLAAVPVFVVVPTLLWLDRFEAEPTGILLFAFGWGAVVATAIAVVVNSTSIDLIKSSGGDVTLGVVLVAPIVEETCKGLAVALVVAFRRREFDGVVDGIVYAGMSGIGFAFTENVLYLGRALADSGVHGLATTFALRCVFGPFAHPLFTMATGVGFGIAVTTRRPALRLLAPLAGWCTAIALHSLWNLSALAGLRGFAVAYVLMQLPIFLAAAGFALWAQRREGRLIARHLAVYAATGWLTPEEVQMLSSLSRRRRARSWAAARAGAPARRAMRHFQDTASELALLRDRMSRMSDPGALARAQDSERGMLQTLSALRSPLRAVTSPAPGPGGAFTES